MARIEQERVLADFTARMFSIEEPAARVPPAPAPVRLRPEMVAATPAPPDTDRHRLHVNAMAELFGVDAEAIATLPVPEHASPTAHHVARAIAKIATNRLRRGDRLDFVLNVAAGRDLIVRELASDGIYRDRSTVADALAELVELGVLGRDGQLTPWLDNHDPDRPVKTGAYVYTLRIGFRQLGDLAIAALATVRTAAFGGEGRIERCLNAAIRLAEVGQRNSLGHWLARRCRDCELSHDESERVVTSFQRSVPQQPPYTIREALATVRSVYRRR
jgi:hypothetical protein